MGSQQGDRHPKARDLPTGPGLGVRGLARCSAGFPYWSLSPSSWGGLLDGVLALRIEAIRLDVPWERHERAPGVFDWGNWRPELALERLLSLARARGLLVWVRPGPWIGPPFPNGGIPSRVLQAEEVRAIGPSGRDLRFPSPTSSRLADEVRHWLRAVVERVAPHAYPLGPVVGLLVGETVPAPAPWPGGGLDYSPQAKGFLTRYLSVKYGEAGPPFAPVEGSSTPAPLTREIERVEAGEVARRLTVGWAAEIRSEVHPGLPLVAEIADHPQGSGGDPVASRSLCDGITLIPPRDGALDYTGLRLLGLRAAGLAPGTGVGAIAATRSTEGGGAALDLATSTAVLAMSGVRALDLRSVVNVREEAGFDAPLEPTGELSETGLRLQELLRLLDAIDHSNLERRADCMLLSNRENGRLREGRSACGSLPPGLGSARALGLLRVVPGPGDGLDLPELDHDIVFDALFDGLRRAGISFVVSEASLSEEALEAARVIFLVSFQRMSRPLAQRLFEWVDRGGTLVVGPRVPEWDWAGGSLGLRLPVQLKDRFGSVRLRNLVLEEAEVFAGGEPVIETEDGVLAVAMPFGGGRIVRFGFRFPFDAVERDAEAVAWIVTRLAHAAEIGARYPTSDPCVETELHESPVRRFLFLANPLPVDRSISVALAPGEALREVRGRAEHVRAGEQFVVPSATVLVRELVRL